MGFAWNLIYFQAIAFHFKPVMGKNPFYCNTNYSKQKAARSIPTNMRPHCTFLSVLQKMTNTRKIARIFGVILVRESIVILKDNR